MNLFDVEMIDVTDITAEVSNETDFELDHLAEYFHNVVNECCQLLEKGVVFIVQTSQGKDSSLVGLIAIEAMRQCRAKGTIVDDHPILFLSVDTAIDAVPMQSYVRFSRKHLLYYCHENGINAFFEILQPSLSDHFAVRWGGANKLIPSVTRSGDCSVILKVDVTQRFLKKIDNYFDENGLTQYSNLPLVQLLGSRSGESARRKQNMVKQSLNADIDKILSMLNAEKLGNKALFQYAPIADLQHNEQVMTLLGMAGTQPQIKYHTPLPAYLPSFGLLIAIYGNGTNEACEIAVASKTSGVGCNGKSRFGCYLCTMGSVTDKSSSALAEHPRWAALGAKEALRFRDWLWRMANDMQARALHARTFDPAYNRIILQPNVLLPKHLEKMTRYASQLSIMSILNAEKFRQMEANGTIDTHPGIVDIVNDPTLDSVTRSMFLEMYKDAARAPVYQCFSMHHAVLLSFRNALEGVGSAPFLPIRIWTDIVAGRGWIPFPKLNSEFKVAPKLDKGELPEAVALPFFKSHIDNCPDAFLAMPEEERHILHYWQRPLDLSDVVEADFNCSNYDRAKHTSTFELQVLRHVSITDNMTENTVTVSYDTKDGDGQMLINVDYELQHIKIGDHKLTKSDALATDIQSTLHRDKQRLIDALFDEATLDDIETLDNDEAIAIIQQKLEAQAITRTIKLPLSYLQVSPLATSYKPEPNKRQHHSRFTTRRVKMGPDGKVIKGTTRLRFYPIKLQSQLGAQHAQDRSMFKLDFTTENTKTPVLTDNPSLYCDGAEILENIEVNTEALYYWLQNGGLSQALKVNHDFINHKIKHRGHGIRRIRQFGGTLPMYTLMQAGVISINASYFNDFTAMVKRTELFDEIGAFQYQSLRYDDVARRSETIPMSVHRDDKAKLLLAVRTIRNAERQQVKHRINDIDLDLSISIQSRIDSVYSEANNVIETYIDDGIAGVMGAAFYDNTVNLSTRAKAAKLWFEIYRDALTNNEVFQSKFAHKHQHIEFHRGNINKLLNQHRIELNAHIDTLRVRWNSLISALNIMIADLKAGKHVELSQYYKIIDDHHPYRIDWLDVSARHWKPKHDLFVVEIEKKLAFINTIMENVTSLQRELSNSQRSDNHRTNQKLSLKDRLKRTQAMTA